MDLRFYTGINNLESDTPQFYIDSIGNVGIGTTSPSYIFHIKETGSSPLLMVERDSGATAYMEAQASKVVFGSGNNNPVVITQNSGTALTIDTSRNATWVGTVSDSKGNLRSTNLVTSVSQYTISSDQAGDVIQCSSGGWIINSSTGFSAGDMVSVINNSGSDQTITATGITLYNTADGATGSRTLAARGMATVICSASNTYYISGAGLS